MNLDHAVTKMLQALNARPDADRVGSFTDAIHDLSLCERCAVQACRKLTSYLSRRPWPNDLAMETRDLMLEEGHTAHVVSPTLPEGGGPRWWQTQGRAIVEAWWPDSPHPGWIADQLRIFGYVDPDAAHIHAELGNPGTWERAWWEGHAARNLSG